MALPRSVRRWCRWAPVLVAVLSLGAARQCETEGTVYGLTDDSAFVVPPLPCDSLLPCPEGGDLGGTFRLIEFPRAPESPFRTFRVEDVFWLARDSAGRDLRITGSGTYTLNEEFARIQRLVLDLRVAGEPRRYDSGDVPVPAGGAQFPDIDVSVQAEEPTGFGDTIFVRGLPFARADETSCGPELRCDATTEICVRDEIRLAPQFRCEPVPAGCEDDRSCDCAGDALCADSSAIVCSDEPENTIVCTCPACV